MFPIQKVFGIQVVLLLISTTQWMNGVYGQGILQPYFDRICDQLVTNLPVAPNCACGGGFKLATGASFNVTCTLDEPICIDPPDNNLCGTPTFAGKYSRRGSPSTTALVFDSDALFGSPLFDPPPLKLELTHQRPFDYRNPIQFSSCAASVGETVCQGCAICENKQSFTFDCTNVVLFSLGPIQIAFPLVDKCIGLTDTLLPPVSAPVAAPVEAPVEAPAP